MGVLSVEGARQTYFPVAAPHSDIHPFPAFDIRITPGTDHEAFKATLDEWTAEEGISHELVSLVSFSK